MAVCSSKMASDPLPFNLHDQLEPLECNSWQTRRGSASPQSAHTSSYYYYYYYGPYIFDKTVFIFNICCFFYTTFTCIDVSFYFLVHCIYSRFSKWRPSAILDFKIFAVFVKNSNYRLFLRSHARRSDGPRPSYCVFSILKMAAVRHLGFSYFRNICQQFKFESISTSTCTIW